MMQISITNKQKKVQMAKIIEQCKVAKKRISFTCPGDLKDEFDKAKESLSNYGYIIDLQDDYIKTIKDAIGKMQKQLEELESKTSSENSERKNDTILN
ncbi:hypothetical protein CBW53_22565 [Yersinia frederiksenii]|nr:hypothetical protein CBW53_22565 [Yersinia frederiksenii]